MDIFSPPFPPTSHKTLLKQDIGIPMGIEPTPFWANLFVCFLSLRIFKILFLKNQIELENTVLLVNS